MDDWKYYSISLVLFVFQMFAGVYCEDIGTIFEFLSAICVSSIAFIWPGVFYLKAYHNFGNQINKKDERVTAWMFIIFGLLAFAIQMTINIISIN